ncbi:CRM-domain containing factor CFM3, chloroplastic/mitochondrial [Punica granatum]|uniref:Uncharacterized protein n=2 Tax=Punica granatum TaxID=22663 RepID=A0A2I0IKH4_PUNGR|nr:CRM-domain containing factor CFM3, chloroplastic/mitochondrial [Punica granatum]PKI43856.1 hypothetical protein CRG98_035690 [Punica granatum]
MALATAKITELPLRNALPISFRSDSLRRLFRSRKPSAQSVRSYISSSLRTTNPHNPKKSYPKADAQQEEPRYFDGERGKNAIEKIVLRLRNLGLGSDDEEEEEERGELQFGGFSATGEERLGDLLRREWVRPDSFLAEDEGVLPWEREGAGEVRGKEGGGNKRIVKPPTLAELTIEEEEQRRLRRMGMVLREKINIPKAGITKEVLEKIHGKWRKEELVRLKFHEVLAHDMKTAHEIVERRTGGFVIWRSGSVMVVYRGANYNGPASRSKPSARERNAPSVFVYASANELAERNAEDASMISEKPETMPCLNGESLTEEEIEYNKLLDGLGPRFDEWWGTGVLPVDADLLPQKIPGYKTPFRLLPSGMRSRLTNDEMTDLRKLAKSLPCHFALGRNRNHQGLAAAIIKLWENSLVAKIAVKRGIQNTNNKLMSEELKNLTGGVLLLRNKYYIVIYRGKDFLPPSVAAALLERQQLANQIQDVEEKVRTREIEEVPSAHHEGQALAGTLAEFYEAQARWGREISAEEREKMIEEASKSKSVRLVKKIEHKLAVAQAKKLRAERLLSKVEASMVPASPDEDQETITEEERTMFRKVGLQMKQYLPLGIRGVFDGVIENMHLHWKHRELVKLISKQKTLAFVEDTARLLEYESGGILVAIERVSKGFALIYYRGKNYHRPISLRPRNLLTKAKALKRSVAMQRHEALSQHIAELEKTIEQMKSEIGDISDMESEDPWSSNENGPVNRLSEFTGSEDEAVSHLSDDDYDDDDEDDEGDEGDQNDLDWEDGEESEFS